MILVTTKKKEREDKLTEFLLFSFQSFPLSFSTYTLYTYWTLSLKVKHELVFSYLLFVCVCVRAIRVCMERCTMLYGHTYFICHVCPVYPFLYCMGQAVIKLYCSMCVCVCLCQRVWMWVSIWMSNLNSLWKLFARTSYNRHWCLVLWTSENELRDWTKQQQPHIAVLVRCFHFRQSFFFILLRSHDSCQNMFALYTK